MHRIFLSPEQLTSDEIIITGDQARHLSVLRVKPGETFSVFDGLGYKYECKIIQCHKNTFTVEKLSKAPCSVESPVSITLAQGIAKGAKMDLIIQKTTELGVKRIIPVITERTQVRHTEKTGRWQKIALSASQQSGRDKIPEIDEPVSFVQLLNQIHPSSPPSETSLLGFFKEGGVEVPHVAGEEEVRLPPLAKEGEGGLLTFMFSESAPKRNLKEVLRREKSFRDILLLIGPEGGFSEEEVASAVKKGCIEASLGPRILRTETASLTVMSIIQYELGDMG